MTILVIIDQIEKTKKNRLKSSSQSCSIELNYVSYFKYVVWKNTYVTRIVNTLQSYESVFGL